MHPPVKRRPIALAAVFGAFVLVVYLSATAESKDPAPVNPSTSSTAGLILQEYEGELRLRRARGNTGSEGAELAARNARASEHIVFDEPIAP